MVTNLHRGAGALVESLKARTDVVALTLFGSLARHDQRTKSDEGSDMDLQVVCRWPELLVRRDWAESVLADQTIIAWSPRLARGGVTKVSILLVNEELDLVIVPVGRMRWARWGLALGLHRRAAWARRRLEPLVLIMAPGYEVLKGGRDWEKFWARLVQEVQAPNLSNQEVEFARDAAMVDLRSIERKLERGELRAAQRWLHSEMAARNFLLMHEWRRRLGEISFHDARRVESILPPEDLALVTIESSLRNESLRVAAVAAERATARLVERILAESPHDLPKC